MPPEPIKVFLSYAHSDEKTHGFIEPLKQRFGNFREVFEVWVDLELKADMHWDKEIKRQIDECDVGVLCLSPAFLSREYITEVELEWLVEFHRSGLKTLYIVPIEAVSDDALASWAPELDEQKGLGSVQRLAPGYAGIPGTQEPDARSRFFKEIQDTLADDRERLQQRRGLRFEEHPFPGLESFEVMEGPVFAGREPELRAVDRLIDSGCRWLVIGGGSGTGKSSFMKAGMLYGHLLAAAGREAVANSQTLADQARSKLCYADFEPGEDPLSSLLAALRSLQNSPQRNLRIALEKLDAASAPPAEADLAAWFADSAGVSPLAFAEALMKAYPRAELWLAVDQFERVFDERLSESRRQSFFAVLAALLAVERPVVRVLLTIRSDRLRRMNEEPRLRELNNAPEGHTYTLAPLAEDRFPDVVRLPADRTGLSFEGPTDAERLSLDERILADCRALGDRSGVAPLLAFALHELARAAVIANDGRIVGAQLSHTTYDELGGLSGAIDRCGKTARSELLATHDDAVLASVENAVFRQIVGVSVADDRPLSRPLRTPTLLAAVGAGLRAAAEDWLRAHERARLLASDEREEAGGVVAVAHEALFDHWPALRAWVERYRSQLALLARAEYELAMWRRAPVLENWQPLMYHVPQQALGDAMEALEREAQDFGTDEATERFFQPEAERLLSELASPECTHRRRAQIGDRLDEIGDPRLGVGVFRQPADPARPLLFQATLGGVAAEFQLPRIVWSWVPLPAEEITVGVATPAGEEAHAVRGVWNEREGGYGFWMARFPVTVAQYAAFFDAGNGRSNAAWREDLLATDSGLEAAHFPLWGATKGGLGGNHPAFMQSWGEAVAFGRWLDAACRGAGRGLPEGMTPEARAAVVRLPSEAEWQFTAAREPGAGARGGWDQAEVFGDASVPSDLPANTSESELMRAIAVGMYPRNGVGGVFDLPGNVWEWCADNGLAQPGRDRFRPLDVPGDPHAEGTNDARVLRGGAWGSSAEDARAASRSGNPPDSRHVALGFRVCCSPPLAGL